MNNGCVLCVFDFDFTLVDDCSDKYVQKLTPETDPVPADISKLYSSNGFTEYMKSVFKYLHKVGVTPERLLECVATIPLVEGMPELVHFVSNKETESTTAIENIIISDGNSVRFVSLEFLT